MQIGAVLEQRSRRQQPDSRLRDAHRPNVCKFLFDHARQSYRQTAPVPFLRPLRHAPARIREHVAPRHQRQFRIPMFCEPSPYLGSHLAFADLAHHSNSPTLHQEFAMVVRLPEKYFGTFGPLEP